MFDALKRLVVLRQFRRPPKYREIVGSGVCRVVIGDAALIGIRECISKAIERHHEGIAYLYGRTDGKTTLIAGAIKPDATTTAGSFHVTSVAMARIVRRVSDVGLQLVGQAHSHPGEAFHSGGDEEGTKIAYDGFVSIVVPDYGVHLPSLARSAIYVFTGGKFFQIAESAVSIVPRNLV